MTIKKIGVEEFLDNCDKIAEFETTCEGRNFFNGELNSSAIDRNEKAWGLQMSIFLKAFLCRFNGGYLLEFDETYYIDMTEWEPDGPKESSFYFYSLNELIDKYRSFRLDDWMLDEEVNGTYPIIPFCSAPNNQILFLVTQNGLDSESPVFMAKEFDNKNKCVRVANDFNHFLDLYVKNEGFPVLKRSLKKPSWTQFLKEQNVIETANQKESYQQIIDKATAKLEVEPDDAWSYSSRGNAYNYSGHPKLALRDFNRAIELDEKEAFFYHCRGDLTLHYGSKRAALIDLDISVKLEPDNKMFLAGRAEALYQLGKLKKALKDCNTVLDDDPEFYLALSTRYNIYNAIGDDEKANADLELINDIV